MNQVQQNLRQRVAAVAVAMMLVPALAQAQTKIKSGFNLFSAQQDVEVGQQSAAEAERQLPLVTDSRVESYVNDIGQRLAANAPGPKFQYRFRVVNASDINAFALPGGFIYINRGTIEAANSDGEVASVLAHEISHAALRHGTHQASKAYITQAGLGILGGILGGKVGAGTAQIINAVGGFGLNAIFLKYSRDAETEADVLGSQILARSGYNPDDMVRFFQTLARSDKRSQATWLSSHPQTADRIKRVQQEEQYLSRSAQAGVRSARFTETKAALARMAPARKMEEIAQMAQNGGNGSTRQQGNQGGTVQTSGTVALPSSSMKTYTNQTRVFQVQYPSNWDVIQEGANGVTFGPPGGYGVLNGNNEIVYGAIVSHFEPPDQGGYGRMTAEAATDELVGVLQQNSPYLKLVSNSKKKISVKGGTALAASLRGMSPTTRMNERVTVVTRQLGDGHLIYLLYITPDQDAARYSAALNSMVGSLQIDPSHSH